MELIDVHAHLESMRFDKDIDDVISRARDVGVRVILNSGTGPKNNRKTLEISEKYDIVKCSFGMYPVGNLSKDIDSEIDWIENHKDICFAIGEIGLDYEGDEREKNSDRQKELFRKMLNLAKKLDKPVVIHSRKAEEDVIKIMEAEGMKKVVMHCFSGKKSLIKRCVENGWFLSVPPVITRLQHFQTLVSIVPLGQMLTETDAPYLSPVAGERNEPANVAVTIKEIAKIKGISEEEVAEAIFNNAKRLFKI
ncbi:MAG: TatD family hydrolase [archaeon]